jgi:hypothetical protein
VSDPDAKPPKILPRRPARPLVVHAVVDAAVIFVAAVLVALFVGLNVWVLAIISVILGAVCAPLTRRAEERALAERPDPPPA